MGLEVKALRGEEVLDIKGGEHHTVALVRSGLSTKVMSWGRNDDDQCGLGDLHHDFQEGEEVIDQHVIRSPKVIAELEDQDVAYLSCMEHANYAYTEKGQVFSWGINSYCKLGTMNEDNQEVPFPLKPHFIINPKLDNENHVLLHLALGGQHVVFVTGHHKKSLKREVLDNVPAHLRSAKSSRKTLVAKKEEEKEPNPAMQRTSI